MASLVERELDLGAQQRERRAQLVAGVRNEAPFALERGPESREQVVERVAEAGELVARRGDWQPLVEVRFGERRGLCAHTLDRAEGAGGERVADQRNEQERDRAADDQLASQAGKCSVA